MLTDSKIIYKGNVKCFNWRGIKSSTQTVYTVVNVSYAIILFAWFLSVTGNNCKFNYSYIDIILFCSTTFFFKTTTGAHTHANKREYYHIKCTNLNLVALLKMIHNCVLLRLFISSILFFIRLHISQHSYPSDAWRVYVLRYDLGMTEMHKCRGNLVRFKVYLFPRYLKYAI